MSLEVIYKKIYGLRTKVLEYWGVYGVSVLMNCIGSEEVISGSRTFIEVITDWANPAVLILLVLTFAVILFYLSLAFLRHYSMNQNFTAAFTKIMHSHSECPNIDKITYGLSWGKNKTLWLAPKMILGLETKQVVVADYNGVPYDFTGDLSSEFIGFEQSEYINKIRCLGNDLPRYMLSRYGSNFDKSNPLLTLQLRKTSWSACQFVWNRYVGVKDDSERERLQSTWRNKIIKEHLDSGLRVARYPNSLCLHLVIETGDGNALVTEISKEKENDYPTTKAVSLGEQLELSDFVDINDFRQDFVKEWVVRSLCEEFGLSDDKYHEEFDDASVRVLALNFEMDIYNFALVCTIKMRHDLTQFKKVVNATVEQKEITDMVELPLYNIPRVLLDYEKNKEEYHPSSYLRLLLFYLYKNGYRRTCKDFCALKH